MRPNIPMLIAAAAICVPVILNARAPVPASPTSQPEVSSAPRALEAPRDVGTNAASKAQPARAALVSVPRG